MQTETLVRTSAPRGKPLEIVVRVVEGDARPAAVPLRSGTVAIGSAPPCDIVVTDSTVSRMHAEVRLVAEGVEVHDLGSRNGTFYLGQRVEKIVLAPGARISIGRATLAFEPEDPSFGQLGVSSASEYRGAIGRSAAMRRIFSILARLEGSLVTVLLLGESGAGKEVIARAIHEGSHVANGPLVTVNCGAFPRELIASELFGHKKGAFTGATESRVGAFEEADGGTLFLDELGELPLELQPPFLRALESGEIRAVGDRAFKHAKVRVIAATNRDLVKDVREGRFREDLYYRLAVVSLTIPPLRERPEDIEPLALRFAKAVGLQELPPAVIEALKARPFPGNARELRNAVHAFSALGVLPEASRTELASLELGLLDLVHDRRPYAELKEELVERFTKLYLATLLSRNKGNQSSAARESGLDRTHLGRLIAKHGIK